MGWFKDLFDRSTYKSSKMYYLFISMLGAIGIIFLLGLLGVL